MACFRARFVVTVITSLVMLGALGGPVLAEPVNEDPPTTTGGAKSRGALTDKYYAIYPSAVGGGEWECSGVRIENANVVKDVFECKISDISTMPPGEYTGTTVPWYDGSGGPVWITDSDRFDGLVTINLHLVITDNGDRTGTIEGVAIY